MANRTPKQIMKRKLSELPEAHFGEFVHELVDRKGEQKVTLNRVEGKTRAEVVNVMFSTFTETEAVKVAVELLREIDHSALADQLEQEVSAVMPNLGPRDTVGPSGASGASSLNSKADDEHFVDKYRLQLIRGVCAVGAILDELLQEKAIHPEAYSKINTIPTNVEKMKELYKSLNTLKSKNSFYKSLERNESFLIAELKEGN